MTSLDTTIATSRPPARQITARLLRALMPHPTFGTLRLTTPRGDVIDFRGTQPGPEAALSLVRWHSVWRLLSGGDVGFAQAYIDGDWTTPDLPRLLEWALHNENDFSRLMKGNLGARLARRLAHRLRVNTRRGSRRNIAAHYDLGNDFYEMWLDRGMSYSSALFTSPQQTLESAQDAKLDRVMTMLEMAGGEEVLEIGIGWGGVLERLIGDHHCWVTGLTLSKEQLSCARARLDRLGLSNQADLRLQDYRDVEGRYDRIVSIEMLEAVGERYWPVYFDKLRACLKPGGSCILQVITIAEGRFAGYRENPDFIQSYIFPGGMLPTKEILREAAATAGLSLGAEESLGPSYARTLREWRKRFLARSNEIAALGLDDRFQRMWDYYLAYCEAGFVAGSVDVSLFQLRG
jgi:cyclopropane-fatty-acyl-phospholipid synthase